MSISPTPKIIPPGQRCLGFGEHANPVTDSAQLERAQRVYKIALGILIGVAVASVIALAILCPFIPAVIVPAFAAAAGYGLCVGVAAGASLCASAGFVLGAYLTYKKRKDAYVGILNHLKVAHEPVALGEPSKCDLMACKDGFRAFAWKKKLIESAQHNIVLSGSYCGGNSFDEILELMNKQLGAKNDLKILIINADKFTNRSNKEKISFLQKQFPQRIQIVSTPDLWLMNPELKRITNHAKILSIDYGNYTMLGGSSLEDKYAYTRGLGGPDVQPMDPVEGMLAKIVAKGFRDEDYVLCDKTGKGVGKRVYLEALKLGWRWNAMEKAGDGWQHEPISDLHKSKSIVGQLLQEQVEGADTKQPRAPTHIKEFRAVAANADTKIFCSAPEHVDNPFAKELVHRIDQANDRIVINHLYFHPSQKVFDALVRAANRGVNLLIVTNGYEGAKSPISHKLFGLRNRYNAACLVHAVNPQKRSKIDIREFNVSDTSLHKKTIVVDDYLIAGSSNIGYKSLETMSDHEINFVTKSQNLADEVVARAKIDGSPAHARKLTDFSISPGTAIVAAIHRALAPLIG